MPLHRIVTWSHGSDGRGGRGRRHRLGGLLGATTRNLDFILWTSGWQTFSVKGHTVNTVSFVGHIQPLLHFLLLLFIYFFTILQKCETIFSSGSYKHRQLARSGLQTVVCQPSTGNEQPKGFSNERVNESDFKHNINHRGRTNSRCYKRNTWMHHVCLQTPELDTS